MWKKRCRGRHWVSAAVGISACGAALAVGCGSDQLQAVIAGIEAAAGSLDRADRNHDEDITFGEWLLSELDD